ncbi:hypothetical protein POVWA2_034990 [Plasmodium ovale wallikeri]|uniref:Uncharacterized protein n=1 Tax=Plasmodium ovale wallikeri TaxID=864142 RepID=A0A1A8Z2S7_PLAOA|nr:hypothetical protein POVWA2_034990 [Plasmodium ovale wallikeri]
MLLLRPCVDYWENCENGDSLNVQKGAHKDVYKCSYKKGVTQKPMRRRNQTAKLQKWKMGQINRSTGSAVSRLILCPWEMENGENLQCSKKNK